MKFAKFWAREYAGKGSSWSCWRWSNVSEADAREQAQQAAQRLAARMERGEPPSRYPYGEGERPMREEVLEHMPGAAITRNGYGCTVLNTEQLMFVDMDLAVLPPTPPRITGFLSNLFNRTEQEPTPPPSEHPGEPEAIAKLRQWLDAEAGAGARVYRTAAGLRYVMTHIPMKPDAESINLLEQLGSDPLYIRLCKAQQCFRARLSPKPWRIGHYAAAYNWPAHPLSAHWLKGYEKRVEGYATCALIEQLGNPDIHPNLECLVRRHDAECRAESGLPLA